HTQVFAAAKVQRAVHYGEGATERQVARSGETLLQICEWNVVILVEARKFIGPPHSRSPAGSTQVASNQPVSIEVVQAENIQFHPPGEQKPDEQGCPGDD